MRIAILGNEMSTMVRFRGPIISGLKARGAEILALCPHGTEEEAEALRELGARHVPLQHMTRAGLNPLGEVRALNELTQLLLRERPDCLFSYFLKPVIWGAIAARRAGVLRSIGMIEGMGHAFSIHPEAGPLARAKHALLRRTLTSLLAHALPLLDKVIVLNPDDEKLLSRIAPRVRLIDGIGVDLASYAPSPLPQGQVHFVMAARLLREKGVMDFAEAARHLHSRARFTLLGGADTALGSVLLSEVSGWVNNGWLDWPGHVADVAAYLRRASVFVLPTRYAEGLPRSAMEAMAMGRPVITTEMSGARHSVTDGQSGIVVPPADVPALVGACESLIAKPERIGIMGHAAQQEARRRFDLAARSLEQIEIIAGYKIRTV